MKALDLFCGLGGWSDGLALEGFEVLGVEIEPKIAELYKHRVIVADVRDLDGEDFHGYDLIVGSPPCRDFSTMTQANKGYPNRRPPNPSEGLKLIKAFTDFVGKANPSFWAMENVRRLEQFYDKKPIWRFYISKQGKRSLWGNIPLPMMKDFRSNRNMEFGFLKLSYRMRSVARARIPLPIARALGRAVRESINSD